VYSAGRQTDRQTEGIELTVTVTYNVRTSGVFPFVSPRMLGCAPASTRSLAHRRCPRAAAMYRHLASCMMTPLLPSLRGCCCCCWASELSSCCSRDSSSRSTADTNLTHTHSHITSNCRHRTLITHYIRVIDINVLYLSSCYVSLPSILLLPCVKQYV